MRFTLIHTTPLVVFMLLCPTLWAQQTTIVSGQVIEKSTKQPVPFADVIFSGTTIGTITDENGYFNITTTKQVKKIRASFLGYKPNEIPIEYGKKQEVIIDLEEDGIELTAIEIKYRGNPAEMLMDSARKYRDKNDMKRYQSYQAQAYIKTQFNLYNLTEKFKNQKLLKPFKFMFENPDTINGKAHYPFLISETLSDIYKKIGQDAKEFVNAAKISGIENENFTSLLGSVYNEFNFYDDNQLLLGKNFVGPLSPIGITYYKYYLVDSMHIGQDWCYKINFEPRISNEVVYIGSVWIHDSTYAIRKIDLKMNGNANINLIADFMVNAEYNRLPDGHWVLTKEVARIDINPRDFINFTLNIAPKSENFRITINKNSSFKDHILNQPPGKQFAKMLDDVILADELKKDDKYWEEKRHDSLTQKEKNIYNKVDSIKKVPFFKFMYKVVDLVASGYLDLKYFGFGPLQEIWSMNEIEGHRIRLGGRTGDKISKRFILEGHVSYGTKDQRVKWDLGAIYHFNKRKNPWRMLGFKIKMDVDQLGLSVDQWRPDNFLGSFLRRRKLSDLSYMHTFQFYYEHDWSSAFNQKLSFTWMRIFDTGTLRFGQINPATGLVDSYLEHFTKAELQLETTFAWGQKFLTGRNKRRPLRGKFPIIKFTYALGIKGFLGSDYNYHKIRLSISDRIRIKPLGYGDYEIAAGKIFGVVPYPLMEIHMGNDTYMFDRFAFNTMNYFEFVSDQWISIRYQHHFDGFFLNKIPGIKKLKLREVIGIRAVMGSISDENRRYIALPEHTFEIKDPVTGFHIPFIEMNAGLENIFNIMRLQFLWRLTHKRRPDPNNPGQEIFPNSINWGIMFGLYFNM
ncbi:MAG: carboxypeptidase-like regulatory domain-containing protein [Candidatus Competibacteraceae bacterium]|nr:carboxypeptidase-like regulatory domain-containing protein [Candidatus Competibacteraceae bacterium]